LSGLQVLVIASERAVCQREAVFGHDQGHTAFNRRRASLAVEGVRLLACSGAPGGVVAVQTRRSPPTPETFYDGIPRR
jgi:hypothetical protein